MQEMSRKNKLFTDSVIRRMTRVSLACGAINLAQGFPDFDPPKALTDRLAEVSALGPHQYPITMGAPNFRQALARKAGRFMGRALDPDTDMVVTIGSTEAMVDTIFALTNPGDKIIMFSPYFENYRAQAIMADCEPLFVPLVPPEFNFDANVLEDAFKQGAKAILICNPSNPSGKVFTYDELKLISELCIKYDAFAIMDEVYEHIVYDGHKHIYMNSLPGMWERTITVQSFSKTYSMCGWRIGYLVAPAELVRIVVRAHQTVAMNACSFGQLGALEALTGPQDSLYAMLAEFDRRRLLLYNGLKELGIPCSRPQAAFYLFPDIGEFGMDSFTFAELLLDKYGVATVPGVEFGKNGENHLRISYATSFEDCQMGLHRIAQCVSDLRKG